MKGDVYKEYYPIDDDYKKQITAEETTAEIDAYFAYLEGCKKEMICSECGQPIVFDKTWMKDEKREYEISALCNICQRKIFGI